VFFVPCDHGLEQFLVAQLGLCMVVHFTRPGRPRKAKQGTISDGSGPGTTSVDSTWRSTSFPSRAKQHLLKILARPVSPGRKQAAMGSNGSSGKSMPMKNVFVPRKIVVVPKVTSP